jgi:predicted permease
MELYLKLFEVLFPVFFVVGIGYYLGKKNPKIDGFLSMRVALWK